MDQKYTLKDYQFSNIPLPSDLSELGLDENAFKQEMINADIPPESAERLWQGFANRMCDAHVSHVERRASIAEEDFNEKALRQEKRLQELDGNRCSPDEALEIYQKLTRDPKGDYLSPTASEQDHQRAVSQANHLLRIANGEPLPLDGWRREFNQEQQSRMESFYGVMEDKKSAYGQRPSDNDYGEPEDFSDGEEDFGE